MKLNEFKAWFEGYTEGMEGAPSKKQWERIKEQVKEIDGVPVSYPVYIDRYVRPYWQDTITWYAKAGNLSGCVTNLLPETVTTSKFDGVNAMYAAGKAEALSS